MDKRISKVKLILILVALITVMLGFSFGIVGFMGSNEKKQEEQPSDAALTNYWLMKPGYRYTINGHYGDIGDIPDEIYNNFTISAMLTCNSTYDTDKDASWMKGTLTYYDTSNNPCLIFPVTKVQYYTKDGHDYKGWYEIEKIENDGTPTVKNQYGLD